MHAVRFGEIIRPVLGQSAGTKLRAENKTPGTLQEILSNITLNRNYYQANDKTTQKIRANGELLVIKGEESTGLNAELAKLNQPKGKGVKQFFKTAKLFVTGKLKQSRAQEARAQSEARQGVIDKYVTDHQDKIVEVPVELG